jgi:flagellar hook-associated protein 2
MPTISSAGIGSGLDVASIVSQLMTLERQPLVALQQKEAGVQADLSAYGQLRSELSKFQTAMDGLGTLSKFKVYKATPEDEDVFTASASSTAAPGTYNIEVVQLAASHRQNSQRYADKDTTTVGTAGDRIHVQVGTDTANAFEVEIGGKTLEQIRDAINVAADNVGVTATLVPDYDTGTSTEYYRLVLTSDETGTANQMTLSFEDSGGGAIADPMGFTQLTAARDAQLKVEGYLAVRSSNTVSDVVDGVTLNLKATTATGVTKKLTVTRDDAAIEESVNEFVTAYNDLHAKLSELRTGELAGDTTLLTIESSLRNIFNTAPTGLSGSYTWLSQVGVSIQVDGTMSLDSTALKSALATDFTGVAELFAHDDQGYAFRLEALVDGYLQTDGLIDSREDGLNSRIDTLQERQDALERRLVMIEQRYTAQFAALDSLIGSLQATSSFLTQQLKSLSSGSQ